MVPVSRDDAAAVLALHDDGEAAVPVLHAEAVAQASRDGEAEAAVACDGDAAEEDHRCHPQRRSLWRPSPSSRQTAGPTCGGISSWCLLWKGGPAFPVM